MHSFGLFNEKGAIAPEGFAPDGTLYVRCRAGMTRKPSISTTSRNAQLAKAPLVALGRLPTSAAAWW
ncbi:hypothetical protein ACHMW6_01855 [Pseudoduganella sp. UC29_106]|uniref:hypothetical protein n=1 Tax=Pseudoduganella sp. UC29_106 TaxID=3374553 RepID=UPI0037566E31